MYKDVGKQQQNQPKSERYFLVVETTRKTRGYTPHKGGMEGAASGARAAAAGLSVPAAMPIDKGQLVSTCGAARTVPFCIVHPPAFELFSLDLLATPRTQQNNGSYFGNSRIVDVLNVKKLSNNFKSSITRCSCDKYGVVHFPARQSENEPRPIISAHFTLDVNGYPVVSPDDQGAPCCVVYL